MPSLLTALFINSAGVFIGRANGFNRESTMLKLPKRGRNGASEGEGGEGGEKEEKIFFSPPPPPSLSFALTPTLRVTISTLPNLPLS